MKIKNITLVIVFSLALILGLNIIAANDFTHESIALKQNSLVQYIFGHEAWAMPPP